MANDLNPDARSLAVILVAPNVSEQMGGEAIKSLQIYFELERKGVRVHLVTHSRVKHEIASRWPAMNVSYVEDDWLQFLAWRSVLLRPAVALIFQLRCKAIIEALLGRYPGAVVHYTSPVSPVMPYFPPKEAGVVIGPLNGNIHYPPAFRDREGFGYKWRRWIHPVLQAIHRGFFAGKSSADVLLVSGGARTRGSLQRSGCTVDQFVECLDSGVPPDIWHGAPAQHVGRNLTFVHSGRLVPHKGADLILRSMMRTRLPVRLKLIGKGPELARLRQLARDLRLGERVSFVEWLEDHRAVQRALQECRALVFPSLAEANGIVVQEAMTIGLPVIALRWGGPAALLADDTGLLICPQSEEQVLRELAAAMDRLADDADLANQIAMNARHSAERAGFLWSDIVDKWLPLYEQVRAKHEQRSHSSGSLT